MGRILSPAVSITRRCHVHKFMSLALTTLLTLITIVCLVLAGAADGIGPG